MKLLIIEEQKGSSRSLLHYLRRECYRCDCASDNDDIAGRVHPSGYDCILIDCTVSDARGIAILRILKGIDYTGGIIFLSIQPGPEACIACLNAGADDYLPQPVHPAELNARILSLIRRIHFAGRPIITTGGLSIDLSGKMVSVRGNALDLTRKEFDLLHFLISHPGKILSKEAIATNLAEEKDIHDKVDFIYAHIKNLKKKLAAAGSPDYISSVYGMGYKFQV